MVDVEKKVQAGRIGYSGSLRPLVDRISSAFSLGEARRFEVLENGYEDLNIAIETDRSGYVAKVFAKARTQGEVSHYVDMMERVLAAGINHPEMYRTSEGGMAYADRETGGLWVVAMRFIRGGTFLDLDRAPDARELNLVMEQAFKINSMDYRPPYKFDSWAIPNLGERYRHWNGLLHSDDRSRVEQALSMYSKIPIASLPHCFVHADMIKPNVIKGEDARIYPIDFSVSNWYPRIHELAIIAANLMYDRRDNAPLRERCAQAASAYENFAALTKEETDNLYSYALAAAAALFMGAYREKNINGSNSAETMHLLESGRETLTSALRRR